MAGRDHGGNAGPGRRPRRKEAAGTALIDKIDTYCKPSFTAISLNFRDSTPPREVPLLFLQLREKMSDLLPDLPSGILGPFVNDEFGDVDSVLYGRRRRRLVRAIEGCRPGVPQASAARSRCRQG